MVDPDTDTDTDDTQPTETPTNEPPVDNAADADFDASVRGEDTSQPVDPHANILPRGAQNADIVAAKHQLSQEAAENAGLPPVEDDTGEPVEDDDTTEDDDETEDLDDDEDDVDPDTDPDEEPDDPDAV